MNPQDGDVPAPRHVLLAEDDILLAATVAEFLRDDGYVVTATPDGAAALAAAEGLDFDVLLTDLRMPVMDGTALIRALRLQRPDLPVVVMSGDVPPEWRGTMESPEIGTGPLKLVHKPMSLMQLRDALRAVWPERVVV
jgi:CheY-like chemotaxis protein